jgi:hypothetical protein
MAQDDGPVDKRTVAVTLKLSDEDVELFRKAGEALYGRDHPVPRSTLIRELAKRGAKKVIKEKAKPKA